MTCWRTPVLASCLVALLLAGGCGSGTPVDSSWRAAGSAPASASPTDTGSPSAPAPTASPASSASGASGASSGTRSAAPTPTGTTPARRVTGWTATVYYTAVQRFHTGSATRVTGCPTIDCSHGHSDLGSYPDDFVKAVHDEGTGHTANGRYLNWSSDVGYWLDSAPRNGHGGALVPFVSSAADADVLSVGVRFSVADCGRDDGGDAIDPQVCARLRAAGWRLDDEFTPGLGGARHVDLYIGEETGTGFTDGPWYTTLHGAALDIR